MTSAEPPSALERMLHGVAADTFVQRHWGRRAGHFPGPRERLRSIYELSDWQALRYVGAVDAAVRDQTGRQQQVAADPRQIPALLTAGMTICADVSSQPTLAAFLAALVAELRISSGEPPFGKLYASPDAAGFAMHMDAHHVFVLQLEGQKTWWYGDEPALPWTLSNGKVDPHGRAVLTGPRDGEPMLDELDRPIDPPAASSLQEVTLRPGDCLYLPPGTWHMTRARGSSVALSISPPRAPALHHLLDALEERLLRVPAWREDLVGMPADADDPTAVPASVRDVITRRLRDLGRTALALDARDLQRSWCQSVSRAAGREHEASPTATPGPDRAARLRHAPGGFFHVLAPSDEMDGEAVFIYRGGIEWLFPAQALVFVRELGRHSSFVASDVLAWDPALDWAAAREVLAQLLAAGILISDG